MTEAANPCPLCGFDMDEEGSAGELDCRACDQSCCEGCLVDGYCPSCETDRWFEDEWDEGDDEDDELLVEEEDA